jgi:hypothetical protein
MLIEILDVNVDGMRGEIELGGDLFFAVAGEEVLEGFAHAGREAGGEVGGEFWRGDFGEHGAACGGEFLAHGVVGEA